MLQNKEPLNSRKSLEDLFHEVDFDPHFSYFASEKKLKTDLQWVDLNYKIKEKKILNNITGRVEGGDVTALMGSSGAGKTSLMNVLAGRVVSGGDKVVQGKIQVNGVPMLPKHYRRRVAYVMQDDLLFPTATVRESLNFSARLRLPTEISEDDAQREKIVGDLIDSLGLTHVQHSIVGSVSVRGVSGGERKRVAIGIELVTNPTMLFLDEPTSGLDSFNAWKVIKILQKLGKATGCCCLCTIHQPSSEVFNEFENVIILSKGSVMYNGTVTDMPRIMADLGKPIPGLTNPADYVMLVAQTTEEKKLIRFNIHTGESKPKIEWSFKSIVSSEKKEIPVSVSKPRGESLGGSVEKSSFWKQVSALTLREAKAFYRDPSIIKTTTGTRVIMNAVIGAIFYMALDRDKENFSVGVGVSAVLFGYITLFMGSLQPQLINFPLDRGIMLREYQTGTYSSGSYLISKVVVETPKIFFDSVIALSVLYLLMGMEGNFILIVLLGALTGVCSAGLGQIIGASVSNAKAAQEYSPVLIFPQMLFSGLFIPIGNIPVWLQWLQYISIIKYAATVGAVIEFQDCFGNENLDDVVTELQECQDNSEIEGECDQYEEKIEFLSSCLSALDNQNINEEDVPLYVSLIVVLAIAFRIVSLAVLVYRANKFTG
eukprot:maker-scaffold_11-snap-gene-8.38-mRNA-1 protein AED:0.01 eAED:0.01 QI:70/1/1/1/1/1/2/23/655